MQIARKLLPVVLIAVSGCAGSAPSNEDDTGYAGASEGGYEGSSSSGATSYGGSSMQSSGDDMSRDYVRVESSEFEAENKFIGIPRRHGPRDPYGGPNQYFLRSWAPPASKVGEHQLYFSDTYVEADTGGWVHWNRASGEDARNLDLVRISSKVVTCSGGCYYYESVGVDIPHAVLEANRDNGYRVKLYAKNGMSRVVRLTSRQISEQLETITEYYTGSDAQGSEGNKTSSTDTSDSLTDANAAATEKGVCRVSQGTIDDIAKSACLELGGDYENPS